MFCVEYGYRISQEVRKWLAIATVVLWMERGTLEVLTNIRPNRRTDELFRRRAVGDISVPAALSQCLAVQRP